MKTKAAEKKSTGLDAETVIIVGWEVTLRKGFEDECKGCKGCYSTLSGHLSDFETNSIRESDADFQLALALDEIAEGRGDVVIELAKFHPAIK